MLPPTGQIRRPQGNRLNVMREILLSRRHREAELALSVHRSQRVKWCFSVLLISWLDCKKAGDFVAAELPASDSPLTWKSLTPLFALPPPGICFCLLSLLYWFLPVFHHP